MNHLSSPSKGVYLQESTSIIERLADNSSHSGSELHVSHESYDIGKCVVSNNDNDSFVFNEAENIKNSASSHIYPPTNMSQESVTPTNQQQYHQPDNSNDKSDVITQRDNYYKLFFKPLDKSLTRNFVFNYLSKLGKIKYFRMPFSEKKQKNLGYGFVIFESRDLCNMLVDHHIVFLIEGKRARFQRFNIQKYKVKREKTSSSSLDGEDNYPIVNTQYNNSKHILSCKPTSKKYHSTINQYNTFKANIRFCLETR